MRTVGRTPLHAVAAVPAVPCRGTLVLLHGLTDSGASWADAVAHWTGAGWRVLCADARGHGLSPRWRGEELAGRPGDLMAEDVVELVQDLGTRVALVGHSMGAGVGAAAASCMPELVWAVVAEDPPWTLPIRLPSPELGRQWLREHEEELRVPRAQRVEQQRRAEPAWPESELEAWAEASEQTDMGLLATGDAVPSTPWPDLLQRLRQASVPVLVVTGTRDVIVEQRTERQARDRGATVVRLPGAGHCVRRDAGKAYYDVVDKFLVRNGP